MFRLTGPCCLYVLCLFLMLAPTYEASRANSAMSGVMFMVCIPFVLVLFSMRPFLVCSRFVPIRVGGDGPRARMESVLPT